MLLAVMVVLGALKHAIFGAISINPTTKLAEVCDLCADHKDGPQCVIWCPKDALDLTTPDQRAQKARHKLAKDDVIG